MAEEQISMMMSVLPGTMTGFAALNSGLVSINNAFLAMTSSFGREFGLMDTIIATTGVVVTQLGLDAMDAFGKFEQGMKIVQMVSGQTKSDIEQLSQAANQFSVQYRTDIDQITEGLQTLGRAGLNSASEQTEVLQNGLNTAKLEGRDLNGVLEELIQNTALLGGDLKSSEFGEQSQYVNDLLVATSMTAPITTHDVSETLKYSGGIAAAAGANIESEHGKEILEDYMGAIAAFAQKGVTGSIAGTALRAFFNKPATQDSSVTDALASIKLKPEYLWEDDEETMKPVSDQIEIITKQMDKLDVSTMDRLQIWSKIVGGKMGQQMMKLESGDIKNLTKDIQGADDATSLAANSMRTYEANLKALGESGAVLQRNVGRNLVFFANPILELLTKIAEFGQQDFMSLPITFTILGFFAALVRRIKTAFSAIRSEFASLTNAFRAGEKFLMGKTGFVKKPDGSIVLQLVDESGSNISSKSPTTLAGFLKQYNQQNAAANPFSLQNLQKAGLAEDKIAATAHLSRLTKGVEIAGTQIPEGQLWAAALKHNLLTDEQFATIKKAQMGGVARRATADLVNIESVIPQIKQCEAALKDLGLSAGMVAKEAESAAAAEKAASDEKAAEQAIKKITQAEVDAIISTEKMAAEVKSDFAEMSAAVSASVSEMSSKKPIKIPGTYTSAVNEIYGPHSFMPGVFQNAYMLYGDPYGMGNIGPSSLGNVPSAFSGNYPNLSPLMKEWLNSGLYKAFGTNLTDDQMAHYLAANRIPGYNNYSEDAQAAARTNIKTYPDMYRDTVMPVYGPANDEGIKKAKEIEKNAAVGAGAGSVQAAQDAVRITKETADEEKAKRARLAQQARDQYAAEETASKKAFDEHTERVKRERLSTVQYGEETLAVDRERLATEEQIAITAGTRAESEGVASSGMYGKGVPQSEAERFRADAASGRYKTEDTLGKAGYSSKSSPGQVVSIKDSDRYPKPISVLRLDNKSKNILTSFKKPFDPKAQSEKLYGSSRTRVPTGQQPPENVNATLAAYGIANSTMTRLQDKVSDLKNKVSGATSTFVTSASSYINRDRTDRLLNFAQLGPNGKFANSLGGLANKALNATDAIGGPFMIAIMAVTTVIEMWKKAFEDYCEDLKEAGNRLKEAYSEKSMAEDSLEQAFKDENPDITEEELDEKMLNVYSTMREDIQNAIKNNDSAWLSKLGRDTETSPEYEYDEEAADGTMKKKEEELSEEEEHTKAIKENTGALYSAAAKVTTALNNYVRVAQDSWWGTDGWVSKLSDGLGGFWDKLTHLDTYGSTFSENGNDFLLTSSQKDENYAGYTEMAGLMLEDFKDAQGQWVSGLRTMMGEDAVSLSRALGGDNSAPGKYLSDMAKFSAGQGKGGLNSAQNAKIQQSMKNDPKVWKNLGKELAKRDTNKKLGKDITKNQNRIKLLTEKIRQTIGNGFKASQIQRAAYIQQLQDMKAIADQAIVPMMQTNLGIAGQTLSAAGSTEENTKNTTGTTGSTNNNAAIIAGLVAVIARQSAKQEFYDQVLAGGESGDADMDGNPGTEADKELYKRATEDGMTADKFYQQNAADYNEYLKTKVFFGTSHDKTTKFDWMETENKDKLTAGMKGYLSLIEATAKMTGYDYDKIAAKDKGREFSQDMIDRGVSLLDAFSIVDQNYTMSEGFKDAITNAYLMAQDEGEGSGGGGSGSGSGSGDKDNDTGTRKERVDLVLCNRKTIPKLNVNLFKKPPSFTILNKNFKLRDVKINSEDKPKAIMAAIKNSFIDIQKRTDPKIIQDEDAVYDPAAATDGTNVPSGSAKTNTS